jgi:hypothetical protein
VPILPGNLSALGLLASNERYERVQTFTSAARFDARGFAAIAGEHVRAEAAVLARRGFDARMRCASRTRSTCATCGQAFELTVDLPDGARERSSCAPYSSKRMRVHFGRADADARIEIVNVRTTAIGGRRIPTCRRARRGARGSRTR